MTTANAQVKLFAEVLSGKLVLLENEGGFVAAEIEIDGESLDRIILRMMGLEIPGDRGGSLPTDIFECGNVVLEAVKSESDPVYLRISWCGTGDAK